MQPTSPSHSQRIPPLYHPWLTPSSPGSIGAARFVHAAKLAQGGGASVSSSSVDQLKAMHRQCWKSGRQQAKFSNVKTTWLDWTECQHARVSAHTALEAYGGKSISKLRKLNQDACLLTLLTTQPPDVSSPPQLSFPSPPTLIQIRLAMRPSVCSASA